MGADQLRGERQFCAIMVMTGLVMNSLVNTGATDGPYRRKMKAKGLALALIAEISGRSEAELLAL